MSKNEPFPTLLYKSPGQHLAGKGGHTYDSTPAKTQEELDALLKDGWSKSLPEAIKRYSDEKAKSK